jgi:hypothetical protein
VSHAHVDNPIRAHAGGAPTPSIPSIPPLLIALAPSPPPPPPPPTTTSSRIRAYQRLAREQGQQLERLGQEKAEALQKVHEAHTGWQAWRAQQREGELAAERRAIEAEVRARVQEEWAAKGEARARREGKEVGWVG